MAPKENGAAAGALAAGAALGGVAPNEKAGVLAGFSFSVAAAGAEDPPKVNAGAGSGAFSGAFSGDLGGAPKVNVSALAGCSAVFASEDAPRKANKPDSPPVFGFSASAGLAGAVTPKENAGFSLAPDAAGAATPKENPPELDAAGALLAAGIPNENAGFSPAGGAAANGDGAGACAAFSSSSMAA